MQTPEQSRQGESKTHKWKTVTSIATVAAFGFGGIAVANPGNTVEETPPVIELEDKKTSEQVAFSPETLTQWEVVPSPSISLSTGDSLDSPLEELEQSMNQLGDQDETMDDSPQQDDTMDDTKDDSPQQDDTMDDTMDDSPQQDDTMDDTMDDSPQQDDTMDDSPQQDDTMDDSMDDSPQQDDTMDDTMDDSMDDSPEQDDSPEDD